MNEKFNVTGMSCSACSSHVQKSVSKVAGVNKADVNLLTNSMVVDYDENTTNADAIIQAVKKAGYGATRANKENTASKNQQSPADIANENAKQMKKRLIFSIAFWIPLMYVSMGHMVYMWLGIDMPYITKNFLHGSSNAITFAFTQFLLLLPIVAANKKYFTNGFKTLKNLSPNMDSLIAVGAGAAIVYGIFAIYRIGYGYGHGNMELVTKYMHDLYFESAGTILTLITIGKYLESRSKGKTSEAITKLMNLAPKTVTVIRDGVEKNIDVSDVVVGDIYIIKSGEAVGVDGVVIEGEASFDEAAITGESMPVAKKKGDNIVSASINKGGFVKAKAVKVGDDTTIAQIIKLVEAASSSKAPIAKMADKIAGVFVPCVMAIALITGIVWLIAGAGTEFALSNAIAVLVISCPCALGLATPVAIMVGTGKGAENGILIKTGEALEAAHLIDTVVLDKTGTITKGQPQVTQVIPYNIEEKKLLEIAVSLEKASEHPLAEAVIKKCDSENISAKAVKDFKAIFGMGISGVLDGTTYYAGNMKLMESSGIIFDENISNKIDELSKKGNTPLIFADSNRVIGIISVADVVKPTSAKAISEFKKYGIHVIMLTGDNQVTAEAIRKEVGIDEVIAGVLPTQKEAKISQLKSEGKKVAMIGDGVNDAPALMSADVGIAIGAGTDIAIESADVVLVKNDLMDAVGVIKLSKAVIRNIKENLFWAFFYNSIGIPLAAGVLYPIWGIKLNPMFGAAAMSLSSVCVVCNALRLKRLKLNKGENYSENPNNKILDEQKNVSSSNKERKDNMSENGIVKTISIEGMMCSHCTGTVEKALNAVDGVNNVTVSLENKNAVVTVDDTVTDKQLKEVVTNAGYKVTGIK
jgi:Cu+-exporting ATPase